MVNSESHLGQPHMTQLDIIGAGGYVRHKN